MSHLTALANRNLACSRQARFRSVTGHKAVAESPEDLRLKRLSSAATPRRASKPHFAGERYVALSGALQPRLPAASRVTHPVRSRPCRLPERQGRRQYMLGVIGGLAAQVLNSSCAACAAMSG